MSLKTVVATGASSGIGLDAIKQLLRQPQPYRIILGARNVAATKDAYASIEQDRTSHSVSVLPLELSDLKGVRTFAQQVLDSVGQEGKIDYLLLNAAISNSSSKATPSGSKWCETLVVNHTSQHYLVHLLREKLVQSKSRLVFVSSGAVRRVPDPSVLEVELVAGFNQSALNTYSQTKFVALLGAHWWRRQLKDQCDVVAVSPGLIPHTGLTRGTDFTIPDDVPDAKSVSEGAASILAAFTRSDFPEDPQRIFLTSWGEWWPKDVYGLTLDEDLQDRWCPGREEIEAELRDDEEE